VVSEANPSNSRGITSELYSNPARVLKIQLSVGSILDFRFWILEKSVNYVNRSLDKGFTKFSILNSKFYISLVKTFLSQSLAVLSCIPFAYLDQMLIFCNKRHNIFNYQ
jgi:hypothetical protein